MAVSTPNTQLPIFSYDYDFPHRDARFDKIEVGVSFGRCNSNDTAAVHGLFRRISRCKWLRTDGSIRQPRLEIRKRTNDLLFSGRVTFCPTATGGYLRTYITFNCSRHFAHNPPRRRRRAGSQWGNHYRLSKNSPKEVLLKAASLGNADNYVQEDRFAEARELNWAEYAVNVLREILSLIGDEITLRQQSEPRFTFDEATITDWTLRSCEIYWEFLQSEAANFAKYFGEYLSDHFIKHRQAYHGYNGLEEINGAHRSWIFYTGKEHVHLAHYAKTTNRIRFEWRATNNPAKIFSDQFPERRYPRTQLPALARMMNWLVELARYDCRDVASISKHYAQRNDLVLTNAIDTMRALNAAADGNSLHLPRLIRTLYLVPRVHMTDDAAYDRYLEYLVTQRLLVKIAPKKPGQPIYYRASRNFRAYVNKLIMPDAPGWQRKRSGQAGQS